MKVTGADFLTKALHRGADAGLRSFDGYFRDLRSGDPVLTSPTGKGSKERNKTWELLLGSLVATFANDVRPGEPDLLCSHDGQRLGLSAKVLYSRDPETQLDRLREAATQLERSSADAGFVAINLVELFPHARMFQNLVSAGMSSADEVVQLIDHWVVTFLSAQGAESIKHHLRSMEKVLSVLLFVPTVIHLEGQASPMVPYYRIHTISLQGREAQADAFERALNTACQDVLSFTSKQPGAT